MADLEEELERFIASGKATTKVNSGRFQTTHIDPLKIAKHFAEWGAAHLTNKASKIASEDLERCVVEQMEADGDVDDFVRRGIDDIASKYAQLGAQWQREKMMKDAVEIKINRDTLYDLKPLIHERYLDYKIGQKVKIIILPSDNK